MNELPPLEGEEVEQCFGWHALNYRTTATEHAEDAYQALTAFVRSYALSAVQAEREKQNARHDEIMVVIAEYGRAEWLDGSHATEDSLEMKEQAFAKVAAAIRSPAKEG